MTRKKKYKLNPDSDANWVDQELAPDIPKDTFKHLIAEATRIERTNMNDVKHDPTVCSSLVRHSKEGRHWLIRTGADKAIARLKFQGVSFENLTGDLSHDINFMVTGRTLHIRKFENYVKTPDNVATGSPDVP